MYWTSCYPHKDQSKLKWNCPCVLNEYHAIKAYGGVGYSSTHSSTSALDGGEWWASRPGLFTSREHKDQSLPKLPSQQQQQQQQQQKGWACRVEQVQSFKFLSYKLTH
jgi:hypothetical protein